MTSYGFFDDSSKLQGLLSSLPVFEEVVYFRHTKIMQLRLFDYIVL